MNSNQSVGDAALNGLVAGGSDTLKHRLKRENASKTYNLLKNNDAASLGHTLRPAAKYAQVDLGANGQLPYGYLPPGASNVAKAMRYPNMRPAAPPFPPQGFSHESTSNLYESNGMMMSFSSADDLGAFLDPSVSLSSMELLQNLDSSLHNHVPGVATTTQSLVEHRAGATSGPSSTTGTTLFPWNNNNKQQSVPIPSSSSFGLGFHVDSLEKMFVYESASTTNTPAAVIKSREDIPRGPARAPAVNHTPIQEVMRSSKAAEDMPRNSSIENFWYSCFIDYTCGCSYCVLCAGCLLTWGICQSQIRGCSRRISLRRHSHQCLRSASNMWRSMSRATTLAPAARPCLHP